MAKSRNEEAFNIQKIMLSMTGVWPTKNPSIVYTIHGLLTIFVLGSATNISLLLNFYFNFDGVSQRLHAIFMSADFVCYQSKLVLFYLKRRTFLKLLEDLQNPLFSSYPDKLDIYMKRSIKITTTIVKLFLLSCIATISSFILLPIFDGGKKRNLPLPFPFDMTNQPIILYLAAYLFQSTALVVGAWNSIAFDNLASSMMGIASAQLQILRKTIRIAVDVKPHQSSLQTVDVDYGTFDVEVCENLKQCVKHHLAVIKLTQTIEEIFRNGFLLQFLTSIVVICFTGFTLATSPPGSFQFWFAIIFCGSLMMEVGIGCVYGNDVIEQSFKISDACYMSDWIKCGPKVRRYLFMIMERSKKPLFLTAGKFVTLSFSSLIGIIKSAFSYAAVLRQLYSDA